MSRTNVFPTYVPELDYKILEETDDETLFRSCKANTYLANLCDDELFWRDRTLPRYAKLVKFREPGSTWKSFYTELVNDAMYLVETSWGKVYVYSDIKRAYDMLWREVADLNQITLEEALATDFTINNFDDAFIVLIYKNKVVSLDDKYVLFNYQRRSADILQYPNLPSLNVKNRTLFYYSGTRLKTEVINEVNIGRQDDSSNSTFVGVFDYNVNVLAALMKYVPEYKVNYLHEYINNYYIISMDSDDDSKYLYEFTYGYISKGELNPENGYYSKLLLVNEALFGRPLNFRQFATSTVSSSDSRVELAVIDDQIRQYYENN